MLVAVALIGCGHKSQAPATNTQTTPQAGGSPRTAPPKLHGRRDSEPQGRLSPAEYRSIEREYALLHPLTVGGDLPKHLREANAACAVLNSPNTQLVLLVRQDCRQAIGFFIAFAKIGSASTECTRQGTSVEACVSKRYANLALALRRESDNGVNLNAELARRKITGLCAASIGIRQQDLTATRIARAAATEAARAAAAGDGDGFARAEQAVTSALGSETTADPLAGIRQACRPPRQASPSPKPKPKPRKRRRAPLPALPDEGVRA